MRAEEVAAITAAMKCSRNSCKCFKAAQTCNGTTHCPVPGHGQGNGDANPSLSVNIKGDDGYVNCMVGCDFQSIIDALKQKGVLQENSPNRPERRRQQKADAARQKWEAYDAGTLKFASTHVRINEPNGDKSVFWEPKGVKTADLALYRFQDAINRQESIVVVCEGEPATDALATVEETLGIVAVGTVCGAGVTPCDAALSILDGSKVILWPDNDQPGARHMQAIAARLYASGNKDIKVLNWPGAPDKGDAADAITAGAEIGALIAAAQPWQPTSFDLADLLERTVNAIRRFIVLDEHQLDALALFVAHSHAVGAAEITAYINISSAEKGSGKTRLIETLMNLVANPDNSSHITPSVLIRTIAKDTPTLFMDEIDAQFKSGKENAEYIRGILNAGYSRGGTISISVPDGNSWEPKKFNVFCPKVFAGIGNRLPDTVRDRSILITMRRAAPNEHRERFSHRKSPPTLKPLHDEFSDWATEAVPILMDAEPALPEELSDRAADIWEPLFAIADLAGGDWPERSRTAALVLSAGVNVEDASLGVMLLKDIKSVLDDTGADRTFTADLLTALCAIDESPWGDLRGKAIDARRLAKELKPYRISAGLIRQGETVARGYSRADFVDAWSRYLPADDSSVTSVTSITDDVAESPVVTLVTANTGGAEEEEQEWTLQ